MPEFPSEAVVRRNDLSIALLYIAGDDRIAVMPSEVLDRLFAAAADRSVPVPVQAAPNATESGERPVMGSADDPTYTEGAETLSARPVDDDEIVQVVVSPVLRPHLAAWLSSRRLRLFRMPDFTDDLPTYGITFTAEDLAASYDQAGNDKETPNE